MTILVAGLQKWHDWIAPRRRSKNPGAPVASTPSSCNRHCHDVTVT